VAFNYFKPTFVVEDVETPLFAQLYCGDIQLKLAAVVSGISSLKIPGSVTAQVRRAVVRSFPEGSRENIIKVRKPLVQVPKEYPLRPALWNREVGI
jgi:hypothetical protein